MAKRNAHKYDGVDLTGKRHERLEVIRKADHGITRWICQCDCGNTIELTACQFFKNKSCGCMEQENKKKLGSFTVKHGMTDTRLYYCWGGMKDRCSNPHYKYYDRYGGRGITICDEWKNSFEAFRDWAYENGYNPELSGKDQSIDRIDLDGNYCPENCRWTNQTEQVRNRRNAVSLTYMGQTMNPYEFARITGITDKVYIYRRLKKGHSPEKILEDWKKRHSA